MPEPLIKVVLFCEWETLFPEVPPSQKIRNTYHELSAKGVKSVFLTSIDPRKIYGWCGKQFFPEAIISPSGIMGYKGRDLNLPTLNKNVDEVFEESVKRYVRLAGLDGDILIKTGLLHTYADRLAPLMDLAALDNRAATPEMPSADSGLYRCESQGEEAYLEWAEKMTFRLNIITSKRGAKNQ